MKTPENNGNIKLFGWQILSNGRLFGKPQVDVEPRKSPALKKRKSTGFGGGDWLRLGVLSLRLQIPSENFEVFLGGSVPS